ncbi:hypothetical protein [Actinomadura sp. KC216]|uniref:hypothetical protein n=1 Tax=Actinomadura sp. KC216 TaxID=2530370 RepID=UPI001A9E7841
MRGRPVGAVAVEATDFRGRNTRFQAEALKANLRVVDVVKAVAADLGLTPADLADLDGVPAPVGGRY